MATNACKFLCLILLFAFVSQGFGECTGTFDDIYLKQSKTGKMIKNTPEWEVRLTNPCYCFGQDIVLSCVGFKSLTPIDPWQISISGNECKVVDGIADHSELVFKYVWAKEFDIKILRGSIACS